MKNNYVCIDFINVIVNIVCVFC